MTTTDLARLRSLAEAATPGPWHSEELPRGDGATAFGNEMILDEGRGYPGAHLYGIRAKPDAALIVWLRNNADALLDAAEASERLREELERIASQADGWEGDEAMEHDPWNRLATIAINARAALATPPPATVDE